MEKDNKKTLILSIVGILVLVIAVVGVSFAMYSFTGTGSKENIIKTGTVTMAFDPDNAINVTNQYPMSDAKGIQQTDNKVTFGVTGDWGTSVMNIDYDLGITNITPGETLTADYIKVVLFDGTGKALVGTKDDQGNLTGGVTITSLANTAGPNGLITAYGLTGGTLTASGQTDTYQILAYVANDYDLPTDADNTTENVRKTSKSETFTFKVGVSASQRVNTIVQD